MEIVRWKHCGYLVIGVLFQIWHPNGDVDAVLYTIKWHCAYMLVIEDTRMVPTVIDVVIHAVNKQKK